MSQGSILSSPNIIQEMEASIVSMPIITQRNDSICIACGMNNQVVQIWDINSEKLLKTIKNGRFLITMQVSQQLQVTENLQ